MINYVFPVLYYLLKETGGLTRGPLDASAGGLVWLCVSQRKMCDKADMYIKAIKKHPYGAIVLEDFAAGRNVMLWYAWYLKCTGRRYVKLAEDGTVLDGTDYLIQKYNPPPCVEKLK